MTEIDKAIKDIRNEASYLRTIGLEWYNDRADENDQRAEWLEELKTLREEKEKIKLAFDFENDKFCKTICPQRNNEFCFCHWAQLDYIEQILKGGK